MIDRTDRDWVDRIIDPAEMKLSAALEQARVLAKTRPSLLSMLVSRLRNETSLGTIDRLLEIIGAIAPEDRIEDALRPYFTSEEARIQSKALKIYAYRMGDARWAMQFLCHEDPRLTANVVEALWRAPEDPTLREFFWAASSSTNGRVAGNAVVGLLQLDDPRALDVLRTMCTADSEDMRAAGAWVLGVTACTGSMTLARRMLNDHHPKVQRNAARAIRRLQARAQLQLVPQAE